MDIDLMDVEFSRETVNLRGESITFSNEGVNEGVKKLYELIKENPNMKTPFFSKELNTSIKNIERWIKQLKSQCLIEFRGSSKTGGYFLR